MDFGKALNSECHDFDLNIPYLEEEDLNSNAENQFSSPLIQNSTQDMNITAATANNGNINIEEVHNPAAFDVVHPSRMYVDSLHVPGYRGVTMGSRRRYRRRGQVQPTDPLRYCTNYHCKTRKTPLWRKGPLGPKTLCNACGISYMKQVRRGVPGDSSASSSGSASVPPATTATVVEGASSN